MAPFLSSFLLPFCLFSFFSFSFSSKPIHKVYIVYLGEHTSSYAAEEIQENHHGLLFSVKNSEEEARQSMLYSYKNSINGFAALLSDEEAEILSAREEVISAYPSEGKWAPHTTRSWEFLTGYEGIDQKGFGFVESDWEPSKANHGKDVIVGMLDSGIWPESKSFSDEGLDPVPARWRGICETGHSFKASSCNRKIIGARYYLKSYEAYYGSLNTSYAYRSPRDGDGHGTHTSSTVAGRSVSNVSALGGFAYGTVSGGAPLARLAVYKVCWPIPGPNPNIENTCFEADMLAAIDDAIGDGVDVLSISIGSVGDPPTFAKDGIAVGALHAAKREIVVVCSAGNSGPKPATVSNLAPWIITVGASSIDRAFTAEIKLGNGAIITGQTVTPYQLEGKEYPLIYAGDAAIAGTAANLTGQCLPNSLSPEKVKGKIVLCFRGSGLRAEKGQEVKRAGGAAIILGNAMANGNEVPVDAHVLPGAGVSASDATTILIYINSSSNPTASLGRARTVNGIKPSPSMAQFSSRGPNVLEPNILKPDITAPGLNILAAWSESSSPTKLDSDKRKVKYNIISGTSMSCPHVSATAVLLKSIYPHWSSSAIRSAMMTTATLNNAQGGPLMNGDGTTGGPFDFGSGHVRPIHAADPGLVYEASYQDYLLFMCASTGVQMDFYYPCPKDPLQPYELNYPSVAVSRLNGTVSIVRTVTNVAQGKAKYRVSVDNPNGISVKISPKGLKFNDVGEKKSFRIVLKDRGTVMRGNGTYVAGSYTWSDGVHSVRSPIVVSFG
ncbi:hypothetical protein LUZ61_021090 [Rhynchospora tenuis]|uniref:Subtilisin-like protease SBT5.6 n=1 Tax=Rhynchospora tenuis TaxID=198213 RepID=A0AAD5W865_9POAL|nr:hypothetical protein LUZ61_021090 [Rhynchospora tenuis]